MFIWGLHTNQRNIEEKIETEKQDRIKTTTLWSGMLEYRYDADLPSHSGVFLIIKMHLAG